MNLSIDGNSAVTTGSSSGLGYASARALVQEGTNVVINGRDERRLEEAAGELRETAAGDADVHPVQGDLTEKADVEALVNEAVETFGSSHRVSRQSQLMRLDS